MKGKAAGESAMTDMAVIDPTLMMIENLKEEGRCRGKVKDQVKGDHLLVKHQARVSSLVVE